MSRSRLQNTNSKKKPVSQVVRSKPRTSAGKKRKTLPLEKALLTRIHSDMVKSRVLEERLIKIYKAGHAYFWIGAPGEEAWGVPLGLLVHKGHGPSYDFLHLHYRGTPTLISLGLSMTDSIRLIMNKQTDPSTGGRNFSNHYCFPQWNVVPVTSPIEVQYTTAIGTAWVQRRQKSKGITIVTGGDAGTAEGDFASCLVWASRKGSELPMLISVQNNKWGISTSFETQHGEQYIADRGKAFGIRTEVINGNDPIETYLKLAEVMTYIREKRRPVLLEAFVSRLYGHSSASGANFISHEEDPVRNFQELLLQEGVLKEGEVKALWAEFEEEARQSLERVKSEPAPTGESVWDHVYANNENADWRKF